MVSWWESTYLYKHHIASHHIVRSFFLLSGWLLPLLFQMHIWNIHIYLFRIHSSVKCTCRGLKLKMKMETNVYGKKCVFERDREWKDWAIFVPVLTVHSLKHTHTMHTMSSAIVFLSISGVSLMKFVPFFWEFVNNSWLQKKKHPTREREKKKAPNVWAQISISAS